SFGRTRPAMSWGVRGAGPPRSGVTGRRTRYSVTAGCTPSPPRPIVDRPAIRHLISHILSFLLASHLLIEIDGVPFGGKGQARSCWSGRSTHAEGCMPRVTAVDGSRSAAYTSSTVDKAIDILLAVADAGDGVTSVGL